MGFMQGHIGNIAEWSGGDKCGRQRIKPVCRNDKSVSLASHPNAVKPLRHPILDGTWTKWTCGKNDCTKRNGSEK
jgi:hypothetical protein